MDPESRAIVLFTSTIKRLRTGLILTGAYRRGQSYVNTAMTVNHAYTDLLQYEFRLRKFTCGNLEPTLRCKQTRAWIGRLGDFDKEQDSVS